ncbi:Hypothetical predicted protein [Paramuricea clavata]|uniref:LicD/FKTN/FKRP nucleotidyltransferase domain-containing protein n=1 Tax=Paramuricea clavata TaxID=317549 RepID=A0A7D9JRR5_PARCT|nr:Hypothetical predicted protein [Paramuricea clavata]
MGRTIVAKITVLLSVFVCLIYLSLHTPSGKVAENTRCTEKGLLNCFATTPKQSGRKNTSNIRDRIIFPSTKPSNTQSMKTTKIPTKSAENRISFTTHTTESVRQIYGVGCKINHGQKGFPTLMEYWVDVAARRNIKDYFICFGSLLGIWLHGQPIPYDHDMDVCIFRKDFPKLDPEEAQRPFNYDDGKPHLIIQRSSPHSKSGTPRRDCKGNFVSHRIDPCSILDPHARVLLGSHSFLDIFVLADNDSTLFDEYERITYARDVILPVMPCKFLGMSTNCANKVPEYLAKNYGKDFMKPYKVCRHGSWERNKH